VLGAVGSATWDGVKCAARDLAGWLGVPLQAVAQVVVWSTVVLVGGVLMARALLNRWSASVSGLLMALLCALLVASAASVPPPRVHIPSR
jgi:hypothetical protein